MVNKQNRNFTQNETFERVREDFLITKKKIYLNNGSIGPLAISTIKSITDFFLRYSEQGPDSDEFNDYLTSLKLETRKRISDLINCDDDEIIFTQSTTEGINFITNGLSWKKSDTLLIRNQKSEHFSNYLPWIKLSNEKDLSIEKFPVRNEYGCGGELLHEFEDIISKQSPRIVSTSHVVYNNGSITPVEEIGKIIKKKDKNILFCIDGAQSIGAIETDVKKIGCDFLCFPAFKWLCGPLGVGVLYINKKIMDQVQPIFVGSGTAEIDVSDNESLVTDPRKLKERIKFHKYPEKYHPTFRNFPGLAGLESALRYTLRIGIHNIYNRNKKTSSLLREELLKSNEIILHESEDEKFRSSIISFSFKSKNESSTQNFIKMLQSKGIILAQREIGLKKIIRASPHFYNSEEDMSKTADEIKSILSKI